MFSLHCCDLFVGRNKDERNLLQLELVNSVSLVDELLPGTQLLSGPLSVNAEVVTDLVDDVGAASVTVGVRLCWFLSFSSRLHFARLFENQTCILASGKPIFPAKRSRAKTSG